MNDQTNMAQLRYLEELKIGLVHAGFEPERIEELVKILNKLYEDAALEKISEEQYQAMAPKYE